MTAEVLCVGIVSLGHHQHCHILLVCVDLERFNFSFRHSLPIGCEAQGQFLYGSCGWTRTNAAVRSSYSRRTEQSEIIIEEEPNITDLVIRRNSLYPMGRISRSNVSLFKKLSRTAETDIAFSRDLELKKIEGNSEDRV
jgi:hypothetical protein